jgi:hypothetical protein
MDIYVFLYCIIQCVPLATEPGISLIIGGPLLRVATIRRTTDTFLFISHTTNVPLFKFRCIIFMGVRIIKEMPGSIASGTPYTNSMPGTRLGHTSGHPPGGGVYYRGRIMKTF